MRFRSLSKPAWIVTFGLLLAGCGTASAPDDPGLGAGGAPANPTTSDSSGAPGSSGGATSTPDQTPPVAPGPGTGGATPVAGAPGVPGGAGSGGSTEAPVGPPGGPAAGGAGSPPDPEFGGGATTSGAGGTSASGSSEAGGQAGSSGQAGSAGMAAESSGGFAGASTHLEERPIAFGTRLNPHAVMSSARARAQALADPSSPGWRAKGDLRRTYPFEESGKDEPYRLVVPDDWDGTSPLPLLMFLHGAGSDENAYLDQNDGQLVALARQHGMLLVSPKGAEGAYGNFLRLSAPFGNEAGAAELMAQVTPESDRANELSEQDVINVLELVLNEYPIDRDAMFLAGHSMGSGGTWHIGGKYAEYWSGLAPMSGPFVQETGYPWEDLRELPILVTEGTNTPSLEGSRLLADWLEANGFASEYLEVDADHGGMIALVLPDLFEFFARPR